MTADQHAISALRRDPSKPFLGDPKVVYGVLATMLNEADESGEVIGAAADILCGDDPGYEPLGPDWPENGLGVCPSNHV